MSSSSFAARLVVAFVVVLPAVAGGCASEDEVDVDFVGVYRPTTGGAIDAIVFSENKDYMLMPSGCRSQSCAEIGRFHFDSASKQLALTATKTGTTRFLPVEVIETSGGAAKTGGSLVTTKSQQLLGGGSGQQLTNGKGEKLAEAGQKLIESILKALIDAQGMQKDDGKGDEKNDPKADEKKDEEKPIDLECQQNIPNAMTPPADAAAYWQRCPQGVVTRQK